MKMAVTENEGEVLVLDFDDKKQLLNLLALGKGKYEKYAREAVTPVSQDDFRKCARWCDELIDTLIHNQDAVDEGDNYESIS